ncbi:MAG: hypothetical protein AMR96_02650 [Candidatus Adiutrix intracellularis]|nr:MAG: hypothetical protein AMR96_02650 [Candidatus Adiutrix intracellularis]
MGIGYIKNIEYLEKITAEAEDFLRYLSKNDFLLGFLNIKKSLITVAVALKSNHAMFERFRQLELFSLTLIGYG